MNDDLRQWVVDTSSLIEVRQAGISPAKQAAVFQALTILAKAQRLVFPPQVRQELEWAEADHPSDRALAWVRSVREDAERFADLETVQRVLARAPQLIDPESKRDQADPYVIALALNAENLGGVSILSNDRVDRFDGLGAPRKLSVATVAGLWDIPVVPLAGFILRFIDLT
ncbi:MAG: DUF4411 family protein [Gemmatimonadaceae bacterium]